LLTFGSNSEVLFVIGIIVYSIGEFIVHPGFIAYVSKIAPKDKVAIYMGAIFISTGVGIVLGPAIMGIWYSSFVESAHMPKLFGTLIVAVGVLTFASFILYNRWINKLAKEEDPTYQEDTSMWTKVVTAMVALLIIPVVIGVGYAGGTDTFFGEEEEGGVIEINWSRDYDLMKGGPIVITDYTNEGEESVVPVKIEDENIKSVTCTLTWEDEPDASGLGSYENQPDNFEIEIDKPRGGHTGPKSGQNQHGQQGSISIRAEFEPNEEPFLNGTGTYNVTITCTDAGDQQPQVNLLGLRTIADNGNDWELSVEYEYYQKKE
ncbi:MAG: MFS transporter, partial [Methanomassiliicoccales archaeon]